MFTSAKAHEIPGNRIIDRRDGSLVLVVGDPRLMLQVAAEHPEPEEVHVILPVPRRLPEDFFRRRQPPPDVLGPLVGLALVAGDVEVGQAGDAPGHQQVHHQRINPCQLGIGAREQLTIVGHGHSSRTGRVRKTSAKTGSAATRSPAGVRARCRDELIGSDSDRGDGGRRALYQVNTSADRTLLRGGGKFCRFFSSGGRDLQTLNGFRTAIEPRSEDPGRPENS